MSKFSKTIIAETTESKSNRLEFDEKIAEVKKAYRNSIQDSHRSIDQRNNNVIYKSPKLDLNSLNMLDSKR